MQKIKQILLFIDRGYSQRSIEKQTGVNRRNIVVYLQRLKESGFALNELRRFRSTNFHFLSCRQHRNLVIDTVFFTFILTIHCHLIP